MARPNVHRRCIRLVGGVLKKVLLRAISAYRMVSTGFAPRCRFQPSCSEYMQLAIVTHGVWKGLGLSAVRITKCHPFHKAGFDPVPSRESLGSDLSRNLSPGIFK